MAILSTDTRGQVVNRLLTDDSLAKEQFLQLYFDLYYASEIWQQVPDEQFRSIFRDSVQKNEANRQEQIAAAQAVVRQQELESKILRSSRSSSPYSSGTSDSAMLSKTR